MRNRDFERERRWRQTETETDDDWDWYYYEYRYVPYSPYRRSESDRYNYGRDYPTRSGREYSDRDYDYNYYGTTYPYRSSTYGRYSGVGPRGYRRSDERIADDINDRLTWHGELDATEIQVEVNDGIVILTGTVDDRRQKRMAEDAAESVSGVDDVSNQLKIRNRTWSRGEAGMTGMSGINRQQVRPGMEVISRDGETVGEVKEVRSNDFLVDRSMARDVYIPFHACQMTDGKIRVNVRSDEVDNQGWEMPELIETDTSQKSQRRR